MTKIPTKSEEQKAAEAEVDGFRKDLGPFVVAAETTRMAMVFTDAKEADNPIVFANDSFLALTGYSREEVLGQGFNFLLAHVADADALKVIEAEFAGDSDTGSEVLYRRKDGSDFWAALFICPVRDEAGEIVQYFASFVDLSRQKQEQAQSKSLIDELNHRVKNTLSTVQSIVSQALRMGSDPKVIRQTIESRLFALSRSHDLLTRDNWQGAGVSDLVKEAMEPFAAVDGRDERIVIRGKNIRIPPKATLALGIAFHELATNAVKYGANAAQKCHRLNAVSRHVQSNRAGGHPKRLLCQSHVAGAVFDQKHFKRSAFANRDHKVLLRLLTRGRYALLHQPHSDPRLHAAVWVSRK